MVVLSQTALDSHFSNLIKARKPPSAVLEDIHTVDLSSPDAGALLVRACEDHGFFKAANHGIPADLTLRLEEEALGFFSLPQPEKDASGPANPFGYGSKMIGRNGDIGWVEYLLFSTNPEVASAAQPSVLLRNRPIFRSAVEEYVAEVQNVTCRVLDLISASLGIEPRDGISSLLRDEQNDSFFRVNHYPAYPDSLPALINGRNLVGFGEHTDPQIISVLRSNSTPGFQICLRDGSWVSVPPDDASLFFLVGDSFQVLTNGRFRSVKHRVLADHSRSRTSMIYFGGPAMNQKIRPMPSLMSEGEESLYKEFTWYEYKKSAYMSRLADSRLGPFEKATVGRT
ncbi:hypothetical protein MLD38_037165 [Melastoma candidum]|uniref:Uncharacterized protein n=1 Tax=Melastoma candidum TaxID=119954 RepID=A0ACB9LMP3_9MYRT|nr:hypothetical protein MLD38_037165 [Melastoma candidum]